MTASCWCTSVRSACLTVSLLTCYFFFFFFSSRRRHTRSDRDWSSDVCSSDLVVQQLQGCSGYAGSSLPLDDVAQNLEIIWTCESEGTRYIVRSIVPATGLYMCSCLNLAPLHCLCLHL